MKNFLKNINQKMEHAYDTDNQVFLLLVDFLIMLNVISCVISIVENNSFQWIINLLGVVLLTLATLRKKRTYPMDVANRIFKLK